MPGTRGGRPGSLRATHQTSMPASSADGGSIFAGYQVRGELGRGGMGVVQLVFDPEAGREVALKVLPPGRADERVIEQFRREARITGQLEHPNIVPIHDVGTAPDGRPYFTMKIVRGRTLRDRLDDMRAAVQAGKDPSARFPQAQQIDVLRRVGEALSFAHSRGTIHRDLKPDNIMIGRFGEVQVMDWGLARRFREADPENADEVDPADPHATTADTLADTAHDNPTQRTVDGDIAGTPAYMAPEQAAGEISRFDQRVDVFALGALLYEMLTLTPPYRGKSLGATLAAAYNADWAPARKRAADEWRGKLRPPSLVLAAIAARAMALEPDDRYPDVAAMVADLDAFIAHQRVSARPDGPVGALLKWMRRHPAMSLGGSMLTVSALVVVVLLAQLDLAARARELAQTREANALLQSERDAQRAREAEIVSTEAQRDVAGERDALLTAFRARMATALLEGQAERAAFNALEPDEIVQYLDVLDRSVNVRVAAGKPVDAADWLHRAVLRLLIPSPDQAGALSDLDRALAADPALLTARGQRAVVRMARGDLSGAKDDMDLSLRQAEQSGADHIVPWILMRRGQLMGMLGDIPAGLADIDRSIRMGGPSADRLYQRANLKQLAGNDSGFMADLDTALELNPDHTLSLLNRGLALARRGNPGAALTDINRAVELEPRSAEFLAVRGGMYSMLNRLDEARVDLEAALRLDRNCQRAWNNRASLNVKAGNPAAAIGDFNEAIRLDPTAAAAYLGRAQARDATGDTTGALADLASAIAAEPSNPAWRVERGIYRSQHQDPAGAPCTTTCPARSPISGTWCGSTRRAGRAGPTSAAHWP